MTEEDRKKIAEMSADGYTDLEIAEELHYSESYIKNTRKLLGIVKRRGGGKRARANRKN